VVNIVYNDGMSTQVADKPATSINLADLRNATGMSTRKVGELMGLSHARIVQIEADGTDSISQLAELGKIYGVGDNIIAAANMLTKSR